MGQYHYIVNLTRREYLHPHDFGEGLKLMEWCHGSFTCAAALAILLATSNGRGGGDLHLDNYTGDGRFGKGGGDPKNLVGSWAGSLVIVSGDYDETLAQYAEHKAKVQETMLRAQSDALAAVAKALIAETLDGGRTFYNLCGDGKFRNISRDVIRVMLNDQSAMDTLGSSPRWGGERKQQTVAEWAMGND